MKKLISFFVVALLAIQLFALPVGALESAQAVSVPRIFINTDSGNGLTLQKADGYVPAKVTILDGDNSVADNQVITVKVRGNSTALAPIQKKAYNIKFPKKTNLFGMGGGKKWNLLANAFDPTLLRNYTALETARELGLEYTSNQKVVELWMDNKFRGCYVLTEPVQTGKDRVDIDVDGNNGMKDFMMELETNRDEEGVTYIKHQGFRFALSEPETPTEAQLEYINGVVGDVLATIKTGTQQEIEQKIDVASFAKYYLINEFVKPVDLSFSSVFFYYKDGVLWAGPAWDYDLSMGNANPDFSSDYKSASQPDGLYAYNKHIFGFLCKKAWFNEAVKNIYREHYEFFTNLASDGGYIDTLRATYADVINRNYTDAGWRPNTYLVNAQKIPLDTYEENYQFFKDWVKTRNDYLTDCFELFPETESTESDVTTAPATTAASPATEDTVPVTTTAYEETTAPTEATTAVADTGYPVTFFTGSKSSINIYYTKDYSAPDEENVSAAVSRNNSDGNPDSSGDGQVNFTVVFADGYELENFRITGDYKNLKGPADTGAENTYRITKIGSELAVYVTAKKKVEDPTGPTYSTIDIPTVDTTPADTTALTDPVDTTPVETGDTTPVETGDTTPVETGDTAPITEPVDTTPADTTPLTDPVASDPVDTAPADTTPAETEPADTTPVVTEPADTTPVVTEPAETEPSNASTAPPEETTAPTQATTAAPAQGTANATQAPATVAPAVQTPTAATTATSPSVTGKKDNTMTVKAKRITVKAGRKVKIKKSKAFKIMNAVGRVSFRKVKGNKNITISSNGKLTVRNGIKKGTYTVKIKISAAGNTEFSGISRTVKLKIRVK